MLYYINRALPPLWGGLGRGLFLLLLLLNFSATAHQPDLSSVVLSKTPEGKWVMQITSALTAFEGEVDYLFGKDSYKTPEAFRELVIRHFKANTVLKINGEEMAFVEPLVILGHETKLVTEVVGMPANVNSFYLKSAMFKDMPHNQSAVILLGEALPAQQYVLNNENEQELLLQKEGDNWQVGVAKKGFLQSKNRYFLLLLLLPLPFAVAKLARKKPRS